MKTIKRICITVEIDVNMENIPISNSDARVLESWYERDKLLHAGAFYEYPGFMEALKNGDHFEASATISNLEIE